MRFKVDENLPVEITQLLQHGGHDATTVYEQHLQGINDPELIKRCDGENRILITGDTDFSDIRRYPPQAHEGIMVLRLSSQSKTHVISVFGSIIRIIDSEPIKNRLWIVEESVIRIRGE